MIRLVDGHQCTLGMTTESSRVLPVPTICPPALCIAPEADGFTCRLQACLAAAEKLEELPDTDHKPTLWCYPDPKHPKAKNKVTELPASSTVLSDFVLKGSGQVVPIPCRDRQSGLTCVAGMQT